MVNLPLLLLPYGFAIVILVWVSGFLFQQRKQSKESRSLMLLSLAVILWMAAYVLAQISEEYQTQNFWYQWMRIGIVFSSFMTMMFSLRHSRYDHLIRKWHFFLVFLPAVLLISIFIQGILGPQFDLRKTQSSPALGLIGILTLGYSLATSIGAVFVLGKTYLETPSSLRWQGVALIFAILLPVAISFQTDVMGMDWVANFDESTFSLVFTVLIFAWIIFRQRLFNFWPVAYETILHNIHDGVIILNLEGQVMVINPAGEAVLGLPGKDVLGKPFRNLMSQVGLDENVLARMREEPVEFSPHRDSQVTYQMRITTLKNKNGEMNGNVVLIYDISEWKRSQKHLTDMATIDFLTGIYNRQHFIHLAQERLLRCKKSNRPCAIVLLDIDHFKSVNDRYGHQVGDEVLKHVVNVCSNNIRRVDILGRYGGEEFIIMLPETNLGDVLLVAERVRCAVDQAVLVTSQANIGVSISLGVALATPEKFHPLDLLLEQADQVLYESKNAGRNRVSVYPIGS